MSSRLITCSWRAWKININGWLIQSCEIVTCFLCRMDLSAVESVGMISKTNKSMSVRLLLVEFRPLFRLGLWDLKDLHAVHPFNWSSTLRKTVKIYNPRRLLTMQVSAGWTYWTAFPPSAQQVYWPPQPKTSNTNWSCCVKVVVWTDRRHFDLIPFIVCVEKRDTRMDQTHEQFGGSKSDIHYSKLASH